MADISPAWIALIGTVFGGVGLKLTETWLNRSAKKDTEARGIRDELRLEIERLTAIQTKLETRINEVEEEVDEWRGKYYEVREDYAKQHVELLTALQTIKALTRDFSSSQHAPAAGENSQADPPETDNS